MRSTWLGLAFTRFGYLADFQETGKSNSFSSQYQTIFKRNIAVWLTEN